MKCRRTRDNGDDDVSTGVVVENDGVNLVVEVPGLRNTIYLWRFTYEDDELTLDSLTQKAARRRGGILRDCTSDLELSEKGISGKYSWHWVQGNKRVSGRLTWTIKRR